MKIRNKDVVETREIYEWLIENIGEQVPHSGAGYRGYGWSIDCNIESSTYTVELTNDVDEETQVLFALRWA